MSEIKPIFSKEAEKQILEINKGINSVYKSIQDINSNPVKLTSSKDYATQQAKLNKELAEQNTSMKQIERSTKALVISKSEAGRVTAKLKLETQLQTKANKAAAASTLGLISPYQKLSKELDTARNKAKNLGVQFGLNDKRFINAQKNVVKLDARLKALDAGLGQSQRNVGNYGSAFHHSQPMYRHIFEDYSLLRCLAHIVDSKSNTHNHRLPQSFPRTIVGTNTQCHKRSRF